MYAMMQHSSYATLTVTFSAKSAAELRLIDIYWSCEIAYHCIQALSISLVLLVIVTLISAGVILYYRHMD